MDGWDRKGRFVVCVLTGMVANVEYEGVAEKQVLVAERGRHAFEIEEVLELAMLLHCHLWKRHHAQRIQLTACKQITQQAR